MLVRDLMSANVVSVRDDAVVDVALDLLVERGVSGLPVVNDRGELVGLITEYDLLELLSHDNQEQRAIHSCNRFMTNQVNTVQADASLTAACRIFHAARIRRLPVVDGQKLVGMLSRRDILRHIRDRRVAHALSTAADGR